MESDAALIREILARECETVNHYEALASRASDAATRALILHLAHEEKEHIAECAHFLTRLDPAYAEFFDKPLDRLLGKEAPAVPSAPATGPPAAAPAPAQPGPASPALATPPQAAPAFTIGSLIDRTKERAR
jgi:hypothetical protein